MQLINENPTKLKCADGEVITVKVEPNDRVAAVRYALNAQTWGGGSFTAKKANPPKPPNIQTMSLVVGVIYAGESGGAAKITITGSGGGTPSIVQVAQAPKIEGLEEEASDIVNYRIFI
ncbi:MAG: hypothetical protein QOJ64_2843 [Acidobacteriota bacterium]|jgi:hypothetical protein|nr:hypothetical protein [Acidobacteriota bacterium]